MDADLRRTLARMESKIDFLVRSVLVEQELEVAMGQNLEDLRAEVAETTTVANSAVALISGISARIQKILDDGASATDLAALKAELDTSNAALAAAVVANTPAEPTPA